MNTLSRTELDCTCLVCGKEILLLARSKHTYTVIDGYINVVCSEHCKEVFCLNPLPYHPMDIEPIVADPSKLRYVATCTTTEEISV